MSYQKSENVPQEWKTLVFDYLENSMTDEQFQEMRKLIEKPAFQRLLAEHAIDQSILRELTSSKELIEGLNGVPKPLGSSTGSPAVEQVSAEQATAKKSSAEPSTEKWMTGRMAVFAAISAMLLVMLTAGLSLREKDSSSDLSSDSLSARAGGNQAESLQILSVVGSVTIENQRAADNQRAAVGMLLHEGSLLSTNGATSFAQISYDDGTSLVLAGNSEIVCTSEKGQKRIQVKRGFISASVSPQPAGKPLLIVTDTAKMEVIGTNLAISASQTTTRLDVTEGKVNIQEHSLGNQADVSAGNYAVANFGEKIEVLQQSVVPCTWKLDFEKGLPEDWLQGTWEQEGLSKDAEGNQSLGAVKQDFSPENGYYSIVANNAWSEGQFRICENSYLQFRVKMEHPEWYQVILITRDEGFRSTAFRGVYEFQESNTVNGSMKHLPPNQWRTVRIPLSAFKRTDPRKYPSIETPFDQRPADPPEIGDVAFTFLFGSQTENRGLVIDDISVTVEDPEISATSN